MAHKESQRWCESCERDVLARKEVPGFQEAMGHGCLTIVSCGLWFPFGVLMQMGLGAPWRCVRCGAKC